MVMHGINELENCTHVGSIHGLRVKSDRNKKGAKKVYFVSCSVVYIEAHVKPNFVRRIETFLPKYEILPSTSHKSL